MTGQSYRNPALTVDAVVTHPERGVLLIRRGHPPYEGCWALPGGFVDYGESCPAACRREVREETGLEVEIEALLDVLSDPDRDPRKHVVSVVYLCRITGGDLSAGDAAAAARWVGSLEGIDIAFDHEPVIERILNSEY